MARYFLQRGVSRIELPLGDFLLGRDDACDCPLQSHLVSRRHAVVHVGPQQAVIEDLDSRNGVLVNGEPLREPRPRAQGDRVYIGAEWIHVLVAPTLAPRTLAAPPTCAACGAPLTIRDVRCRACGAGESAVPHSGERVSSRRIRPRAATVDFDALATQQHDALELLAGVARKSIDRGRYEDAQRLVAPQLEAMLERRAQQDRSAVESDRSERSYRARRFNQGVELALELAAGVEPGRWIDWVLRMHIAEGRVMAVETVDALHLLVRQCGYHDRTTIERYLGWLHAGADAMTPADRFALRRIEGLAGVIAA